MSPRSGHGWRSPIAGRTLRRLGPALVLAVVLVAAAGQIGRSEPPPGSGEGGAAAGSIRAEGSAAGSAAASLPGSVPASDAISYGLAEPAGSLPGSRTPADDAAWSQIRADIAGSGACWLRSDLDSWLMHAIDAYDWLGSPSACTASARAPVKVLAILDQQTVWAARGLCPGVELSAAYRAHPRSFSLDDWRRLVGCVARRFAGRISAYEIWNEPLLANSMMGYEDGSAAHYADLLRIAAAEIKAVDPSATVLALGGSDLFAGGDRARLDLMRSFTTDLVALGAAQSADAISLHAYPWDRDDDPVWTTYQDELRFQEQAWAKPVWITETGQRASDDGTQVAYMTPAYSLFVRAGVRHLFWFSITDQPDGDFGLRGRPVESALRAFALGRATGETVAEAGPPAGGVVSGPP